MSIATLGSQLLQEYFQQRKPTVDPECQHGLRKLVEPTKFQQKILPTKEGQQDVGRIGQKCPCHGEVKSKMYSPFWNIGQ